MAKATLQLKGGKVFIKALERTQKELKNPKKTLESVGKKLVEYFKKNMESEGVKLTKKRWQALSPVTLMDKSRKGFGDKRILERTGNLRRSIKMVGLTKSYVEIGNTAPYYKKHQLGDKKERIPQRKMIGVNNEVKEIAIKQLGENIKFKGAL